MLGVSSVCVFGSLGSVDCALWLRGKVSRAVVFVVERLLGYYLQTYSEFQKAKGKRFLDGG